MTGGSITGNLTGVSLDIDEFTMRGGEISGNGLGVEVLCAMGSDARFIMEDGEISGNKRSSLPETMQSYLYETGGVVVDCSDTSFSMKGGTISGNESTVAGGGVNVYRGEFSLSGGTITENTGEKSGGIYIGSVDDRNRGLIYLSGTPNVSGNTGGDLWLAKDQSGNQITINITGDLTDGSGNKASLGVDTESGTGVFTAGFRTKSSGAPADYFFSSSGNYGVRWDGSEAEGYLGYPVVYDANGAQGTVPAVYVYDPDDTRSTVAGKGSLVNGAQRFTGWNTAADGSGSVFEPGRPFADYTVTSKLTLYAQWIPVQVTVIPGTGMTKTADSGAESQAVKTETMTPVVYTADKGYYFPENYSVASVNGISVTWNSWTQITVSGTPADDTEITLKAASAKVKENMPSAVFTASGPDSGTLTKVSDGMKYSLDGGSSWKDISGTGVTLASGVTAAKGIKVYQPASDANTRIDSDVQTITLTQAAKPTSPASVGCTTVSNNDGKLTGVAKTMEYKKSDASSWTSGTGSDITGLVPGTYYVRVKAAGSVLASENLTLEVGSCPTPLAESVTIRDANGTDVTGKTADADSRVLQLKAAASPAGALQKFTWKGSDDTVGTVDANGKVTFKKAGSLTVTVTAADGSKRSAKTTLSYDPVRCFVIRCYNLIMGRGADAGGLKFYMDRLKSGELTGAQMVMNFINSPEFQGKKYGNEKVVELLYLSMMDRAADAGGLAFWSGFLNDGLSQKYIVRGFAGSAEFKKICSTYGITPGTVALTENRDKNPKVTAFVSRCYNIALGRKGDVNGLNYWTGKILDKTLTPQQVADSFVFSKECLGKNLNDSDFVKMLYNLYMGRNFDQGGLTYWLGKLSSGMSRQTVAKSFGNSNEFKTIVASYGL